MTGRMKTRAALLLGLALALSGCDTLPKMNFSGPGYQPLTSEVAEIAAPQPPAPAATRPSV